MNMALMSVIFILELDWESQNHLQPRKNYFEKLKDPHKYLNLGKHQVPLHNSGSQVLLRSQRYSRSNCTMHRKL